MIKYKLGCECKYTFDSWFSSSSDYEKLRRLRHISCPKCNSKNIKKSIMMPQLKSKSNKVVISKKEKDFHTKLTKLQDFVEKNCEYVGEKFAQEARNIHYDKKKSKGIYGKATPEQTTELIEEGIDVATIPWSKKNN